MSFSVVPLLGIPMLRKGDDLCAAILQACQEGAIELTSGDVLCVAQKVVSKVEGRLISLDDVTPTEEARTLAEETDKDPRLAQLILLEFPSDRIRSLCDKHLLDV